MVVREEGMMLYACHMSLLRTACHLGRLFVRAVDQTHLRCYLGVQVVKNCLQQSVSPYVTRLLLILSALPTSVGLRCFHPGCAHAGVLMHFKLDHQRGSLVPLHRTC
jgi:hypothetical protein